MVLCNRILVTLYYFQKVKLTLNVLVDLVNRHDYDMEPKSENGTLQNCLGACFKMKDLGVVKYFVGL